MSTKIFNGLVIDKPLSLREAADITKRMRARIEPLAQSKVEDFLVRLAVGAMDKVAFGASVSESARLDLSPRSFAWRAWDERREKLATSGMADPAVDLGFELLFIPGPRGKTLCMHYSSERSWVDIFTQEAGARDFSYWNNTDAPEGMDPREWRARKKAWDEALAPFHGVPDGAGVKVNFSPAHVGQTYRPSMDVLVARAFELTDLAPARRAAELVEVIDFNAYAKEREAIEKLPEDANERSRALIGFSMDWRELTRSEGNPRREIQERLAQSLIAALPLINPETLALPLGELRARFEPTRRALEERDAMDAALRAPEERSRRPKL